MKIAIITPGILPVPSVKGGAVETLIDYIVEYNECFLNHEITVYGVDDNKLSDFNFNNYKKTCFDLLRQQSLKYRLKRKIYSLLHHDFYYNSFLDYFIASIGRKISDMPFDVIIVENRPGFILPLSLCTNTKIVLHLHNDTLDKETKNAKDIVDCCSAILTVSDYVKQKVCSITPTDKVHVVYNGIDLDCFQTPHSFDLSRTILGLSDDDFVVVYTGRIEQIKGVKELLEAFTLLSDHINIKLLIVGGNFDGSNVEGQFMTDMRELASQIHEKVLFTGFQPYEKIPAILSLCDMAVIPSICEDALTMASLEDMASGLPLVVTRSGGIPEAVDEECAIIVERDSNLVENIAKSILILYDDQNMRLEMSKHAKERSALFTKETFCESFFQIIETYKN